jgi:hypothetical protein
MLKDFDVNGDYENVRAITQKLITALSGNDYEDSIHALAFIVAIILDEKNPTHAEMLSACTRFANLSLSIADANRNPSRSN